MRSSQPAPQGPLQAQLRGPLQGPLQGLLLGLLVVLVATLVCGGYLASRAAPGMDAARVQGEGDEGAANGPSYARAPGGLAETRVPLASGTVSGARHALEPAPGRTRPGGAVDRGVVRGRVLDAGTGEPVPHFHLTVTDPTSRDEKVETDGEGRFTTSEVFRSGRLTFLLRDDPRGPGRYGRQRHMHAPENGPIELRVPIGPTYRVRLALPAGYHAPDFCASVEAPGARGAPWSGRSGSRLRDDAFSAATRCFWVRLHPLEVTPAPGPPWTLVVESEDGYQRGTAFVTDTTGIHPGILDVTLAPFGALRGRVDDASGEAGMRYLLALVPEFSGGRSLYARSDHEGRYVFPCVAAGDYLLKLDVALHRPIEEGVRIEIGEDAVRKIQLQRLPSAGVLRGSILTESGRPGPPCAVTLERAGQSVAYASVAWGESVGRFEFASVPAGEHALALEFGVQGPVVDPPRLVVQAPREDVVFTLRDLTTRVRVVLELHDARSGATVDVGCALWTDFEVRPYAADEDVLLDSAAPGSSVPWAVRSPGFVPAFGEVAVAEDATDEVRARVALHPGWGVRFQLTDEETGRPIPGVVLELDGVPTAPSDARGYLVARAAARPERLAVGGGRWNLASSKTVNSASGRFDDGQWWSLPVQLRK